MKKILIATSAEGHVSIAEAAAQSLKPYFEVSVLKYKIKEFDLYLPIYQLFPSFFKYPYKLAEYKTAHEFARRIMSRRYEKKLMTMMAAEHPDIVISTYFMYDHICAAFGKKYNIPVFNILANPHSLHPLELCEEATANIVFDETAKKKALSYEIAPEKVGVTGWFVREQFKPTIDKVTLRDRLHLPQEVPTFLLSAGSDGTGMILTILPMVFQIKKPVQIIVICGNNKSLYKAVRVFERTFRFTQKNSPVTIQVHGFVKNMHEYMQASDLVIGKAGPNSLFESVATHIPFFAATHISGQEDANLDIIRDHKLGFVEENPLKAISLLKEVSEHPEMLSQFREPIAQMARYNSESGEKLRAIVERFLA